MSISAYTYPEVFCMNGNDTTDYIGIKEYNRDNYTYTLFSDSSKQRITFQNHPKIDDTTRPLIIKLQSWNNGIDLNMEYYTEEHSEASPVYTTVYGVIKTIDHRTGEDVSGNYIGSTGFSHNVYASAAALPTTGVLYEPSRVIYYPGEATVGKEATSISPFGIIFSQKYSNHPISELSGEVRNATINANFMWSQLGLTLSSDAQLEGFTDDLIDHGNGENPIGEPRVPSDKPFENNPSRPGGGYGDYTGKGDETGKPGLPSSGVLSSGFIAMYTPTLSQLQDLGDVLWSDDFINNFLKLWNDPMEAIISLGLVPFIPSSSGSTSCQVGNFDTEVVMPRVTAQYQTFSCGSVPISEFWGNALDYGPYTQAEIFLPFVGMRQLDIDDVMNKTVEVDYNVDLLGGEAVCYVTVDNRVLYDFRCNLQTNIPISSNSYANLYSGILTAAKGIAIGAAAGGVGGAAAGALTSAVNVVNSKHSTVERGGELSPNAGTLGLLTPYIILHRPVQSLPSNFGHFKGYPSNITRTLGNLSGYTEVDYIHLDGIAATEEEKEEILSLLKAGVIL